MFEYFIPLKICLSLSVYRLLSFVLGMKMFVVVLAFYFIFHSEMGICREARNRSS